MVTYISISATVQKGSFRFGQIDHACRSNSECTVEQLQDWMGKDFSWGATKRKQINNERKRGREINVVKEELRGITY